MLIRNDEECKQAGRFPLTHFLCGYCSVNLTYPIVIGQDRNTTAFHAKCAAELASDIMLDIQDLVSPLQEPERISEMAKAFRAAAKAGHTNAPPSW